MFLPQFLHTLSGFGLAQCEVGLPVAYAPCTIHNVSLLIKGPPHTLS